MSQNPFNARNVEFLNKQVKKLKKQHVSHVPGVVPMLQASSPALARLSPDQIFAQSLHQYDYQAAVAHQFGFSSWETMVGCDSK
jgi:hypothetical protein